MSITSTVDEPSQTSEPRNPLGAIGNDLASGQTEDEKDGQVAEIQDPLAGMSPVDKWGIKGFRTLMANYPDYTALILGIDPSNLGLDVNSPE
jgi:CCR4-NOT transcription complex subunit 2